MRATGRRQRGTFCGPPLDARPSYPRSAGTGLQPEQRPAAPSSTAPRLPAQSPAPCPATPAAEPAALGFGPAAAETAALGAGPPAQTACPLSQTLEPALAGLASFSQAAPAFWQPLVAARGFVARSPVDGQRVRHAARASGPNRGPAQQQSADRHPQAVGGGRDSLPRSVRRSDPATAARSHAPGAAVPSMNALTARWPRRALECLLGRRGGGREARRASSPPMRAGARRARTFLLVFAWASSGRPGGVLTLRAGARAVSKRGACVRSDVAGLASSGPSPLLRVSHGKSREPRASVRPPRPPFLFGPATRRADTTIALIARAGARSRSACEVGRSIENSFPGRDRLAVNRVCAIRGAAARAPRRAGGPPPRRLRRAGWASGRRSGARGP